MYTFAGIIRLFLVLFEFFLCAIYNHFNNSGHNNTNHNSGSSKQSKKSLNEWKHVTRLKMEQK